jgi:valyl-tRNA synthetase
MCLARYALHYARAQAMEAYDFSTATQTAYAWWQYELCDVFIELMKPVMARDEAADPGERDGAACSTCLHPGMLCTHRVHTSVSAVITACD